MRDTLPKRSNQKGREKKREREPDKSLQGRQHFLLFPPPILPLIFLHLIEALNKSKNNK